MYNFSIWNFKIPKAKKKGITCDYTVDKQNTLNDIHIVWPALPFQMQVSLCYRQHRGQSCQIICMHEKKSRSNKIKEAESGAGQAVVAREASRGKSERKKRLKKKDK